MLARHWLCRGEGRLVTITSKGLSGLRAQFDVRVPVLDERR
jgi:hypothetical protein